DRPDVPALQGAQAERLRVPLADTTLVPVPAGLDDVDALLLADNLPTGWYAVARAEVAAGAPLVVLGLGAVGLCAVVAAMARGAAPVIAVDVLADRRERATALGARAAAPEECAELVRSLAPDGVTAVVDAAGSAAAQALGLELLRPGGTLSTIAVPTRDRFGFSPAAAYDVNATIRIGRAPVRSLLDELLSAATGGTLRIPGEVVVTHP